MDDIFYFGELYDIYGNLLTEKQKLYFEDYYFNNLSLGEIAENYSISRNAVHNQLQLIIKHLKKYDEKLDLLSKKRQFEKLIESNDEYVKTSDLKDLFM